MRKLITASTLDVLPLEDARAHLNVSHHEDDTLILAQVSAAIEAWQEDTGCILGTSTWEEYFHDWPALRYDGKTGEMVQAFRLSAYPLISVINLKYTDSAGVESTVSASDYVVSRMGRAPEIHLAFGKSWPAVSLQTGAPITLRYVAGHATVAEIPKAAIHALKLRIGSMYELREDVATSDRGAIQSAYIQGGWESFARRYRIEC